MHGNGMGTGYYKYIGVINWELADVEGSWWPFYSDILIVIPGCTVEIKSIAIFVNVEYSEIKMCDIMLTYGSCDENRKSAKRLYSKRLPKTRTFLRTLFCI